MSVDVDLPTVYSNTSITIHEWLSKPAIQNASNLSQGQQWKGHNESDQCNRALHVVAQKFFESKKHKKAVFIPYWASINQEYFTADKLPIDYFYRILIEKSSQGGAEVYNSKWSPGHQKDSLNIWDSKNECFKIVLYGFLENLQSNESFPSGKMDATRNEISIPFTTITLHTAPFIYWLGIPKDMSHLV